VKLGGLVIVDNLVWSGRVAEGVADEATSGIREYLDLMWNDANFLSSLMPVRDGVGVSLRIR
jgi:predicted O-methyltransferase YrrM